MTETKKIERLGDRAVFAEVRTNATKGFPQGELMAPGDYGEIYAENNSTPTVVDASTDFFQITIFNTNGLSKGTIPDHTEDHLTIRSPGDYFVVVSASVLSGTGTAFTLEGEVQSNNGTVRHQNIHFDRTLAGGGGDVGSVSLSGIAAFAAGDTPELWMRNKTGGTDFIVEDVSLVVYQVGIAGGGGARGPKGDSGAAGAVELVDSVSLGASGGTITHTFEAGYDYWAKISQAVTITDNVVVYLRMNGDSGGTKYSWKAQQNATNVTDASDSEIQLSGTSGVGSAANEEFGPCRIDFGEMSSASLFKRMNWLAGFTNLNSNEVSIVGHGMWQDAAAVTSIFIGATGGTPHFDSGVFTLYRSSRT